MSDERYELHKRLQDAMFNANASFRDLASVPHIAFSTFYQFTKKPELARDRTLTTVRLACEFLEAACIRRLLPLPREKVKEKQEIIKRLYIKWSDNSRSFPANVEV